jgi:hypothetical protein
MSPTLKAKALRKANTTYTIITEEGEFISTEFAPNATNLKDVVEAIEDGYEIHRTVSVKTTTGDIDFVFSQDTKLEEVKK